MLKRAVEEIQRKREEDDSRRLHIAAQRAALRRVDGWLNDIETMLEEDRRTVPEPLLREIGGFLREVDPRLARVLVRNRAGEASRVLDVLFDAQEFLLPRVEIPA